MAQRRSKMWRGVLLSCAAAVLSGAAQAAHVRDIEIKHDGDGVSILVTLSEQPTSAAAQVSEDGVTLQLQGAPLRPFTASPAPGRPVTRIAATPDGRGGAVLTLEAAGLESASTTLYRRAVLVEAKLKGAADAPKGARASAVGPAESIGPPSLLAAAGLDDEACETAMDEVAADPWNLAYLGDAGVCHISLGEDAAGRAHLEQLAAFSPEDWRAPYGLAEIARREGEDDAARADYAKAVALAEQGVQDAIRDRRNAFYPDAGASE